MLNFELTDEQKALVEETRRFVKERIIPVAAEADRKHEFPRDVFEEAFEMGIVNPTIDEAHGGAGIGEVENALLTEELAFGCTGGRHRSVAIAERIARVFHDLGHAPAVVHRDVAK